MIFIRAMGSPMHLRSIAISFKRPLNHQSCPNVVIHEFGRGMESYLVDMPWHCNFWPYESSESNFFNFRMFFLSNSIFYFKCRVTPNPLHFRNCIINRIVSKGEWIYYVSRIFKWFGRIFHKKNWQRHNFISRFSFRFPEWFKFLDTFITFGRLKHTLSLI